MRHSGLGKRHERPKTRHERLKTRYKTRCHTDLYVLGQKCLCVLTPTLAGAFSRFYYGWIASRPEDIFQSLSLVYLERANGLGFGAINDERIIQWWTASATTRFTGLGWWVCELIDPLFHQIPFLSLATFVYSHPTTQNLQHELTSGGVPLIALAAVVGPAQRFFWDLSTCGHTGCDGPYHGFLSHISPLEQMFW